MKKLRTLLTTVLFAAFFASCTTTGPSYKSVKYSLPPIPAGSGRVFVYRDAVLNPKKVTPILFNGEQVGLSKALGFFYLDIPADNYKVELSGESGPPVSFTLSAGQTLYVRINVHSNFGMDPKSNMIRNHQYPEVVDDATAQRELVPCKYTGPAQQ